MKGAWALILVVATCVRAYAIANLDELAAAADRGDADAQCLQGIQIFIGGPLVDPRLAGTITSEQLVQSKIEEWLKKIDAQYIIQEKKEMQGGGAVGKMVAWFEKSAGQGNRYGKFCLGVCKKKGLGTALDLGGAFRLFAEAADQKYPKAESELGWGYLHGRGTRKDPVKAYGWFHKASLSGELSGKVGVGLSYLRGSGVAKDEKKAAQILEETAGMGDSRGLVYFGECLLNGQGVEKDVNQGVILIRRASETSALGKAILGSLYQSGTGVAKDPPVAFENYQEAAYRGSTTGMVLLANAYWNGIGTVVDHRKAVEWYRIGSDYGSAACRGLLGRAYCGGVGVEPDREKGTKLLQEAVEMGDPDSAEYLKGFGKRRELAEKGDANAQYSLGWDLLHGYGGPKDERQGVEWLEKAYAQGKTEAATRLGNAYLRGEGVKKDFDKAVEFFTVGASRGEAKALCNLGFCFQWAKGVPKDMNRAIHYYQKAVEKGDDLSNYFLGLLYHYGTGVPQDYSKALNYYLQAASHSEEFNEEIIAQCQTQIGILYFKGLGCPPDRFLAVEWFVKATSRKRPDPQGLFYLGSALYDGLGVDQDRKKGLQLMREAAAKDSREAIERLKKIDPAFKVKT